MLLGLAVYLIAYRLPLFADFSYLLPQDVAAVKDLRKLEARVRSSDTALVVIQAPNPEERAAATQQMLDGVKQLPADLVARVDGDEIEAREFIKSHFDLYFPLPDLEKGRDALKRRMDAAKLAADPLYIDLQDHNPADEKKDQQQIDDLRQKIRDAKDKLDHPTNVSKDGKTALLQVRIAFRETDVKHSEKLLDAMAGVRTKVVAAHPDVKIGFTGGAVTALSEHGAISKGIVMSSLVTAVLVGLLLALYFRSATLLVMLVGTIGIATAGAFGAAALTVGHLNAATAFLGAIIAGNGINYGILLIARYLEERRRRDLDDAIAAAIVGTLRPTAVASLGASIAYGSLAATSFKGFADFAVIGAIGMMLCWIASYTLLPALMVRFGRATRIYHGDPLVGSTLVRVLGFRSSKMVVGVSAVLAVLAIAVVGRYIAADPFEYDIRKLRSEGEDAQVARHWMDVSDQNFGRGYSGRTVIAADTPKQVPLIIDALHAIDKGKPEPQQTIGSIESIEMFVPRDQSKRLSVLADIRRQLDDPALDNLEDKDRKELLELRPPDDLKAVSVQDMPKRLLDRFTEKDGRVGYLISIRPANHLDEWNGHDLIRFASTVRELHLPDGETVTTSGASVIFADIVESIERDGPLVTLIAAAGLIIMVVLLVGRNRRAVAVLAGTAAGSLLMVAICALLDLRVNFLDFVALPITLGLGIDYAINIAHRHDTEENPDPIRTLRTSGSAVFVCSLTTMIGYGSLLVSENLAIRGFGTASLIGEVTCLLTALVLVPALLAVGKPRPERCAPAEAAAA